MCYEIRLKNFTCYGSNKAQNKLLKIDGNTPSDATLELLENTLEGFKQSKKGYTCYDTLTNRMKLKDIDRHFVPVLSIKFERGLEKYLDSDLKEKIFQNFVENKIFSGFIRSEKNLLVLLKNSTSKAKLAAVNPDLGSVYYYKQNRIIKTDILESDLPF